MDQQYIRDEYSKGTPAREIAEALGISRQAVKSRAARDKDCPPHGGFSVGGIMGKERSLKGEKTMREPTKAELAHIEKLLESNGYAADKHLWHMAWVHLWGDDGKKLATPLIKNPKLVEQEDKSREEFLKRLAQAAPRIRKQPLPTKNLAVFASFDVHIGKHCELIRTGNEYTPDKAVRQVLEGQAALYNLTKPFGVSDILLPMGNDVVHVDNNSNTTTSGTPQDTYGSVESQMMLAAEMYIKTIEWLAKSHNVWLCHVHSNHDRVSGWAVSQIVGAYFHNHPRVHAAADSMSQQHRKYFVFGNSLIMLHHGEAKEEKLLGVIKAEAGEAMAQTNRIYCYQGHTHHKTVSKRGLNTEVGVEKDHSGLTVIKAGNGAVNQLHVETIRSPSPSDDWHSRSIYCNIPSVEVFLHNEQHQFCRFTHWF